MSEATELIPYERKDIATFYEKGGLDTVIDAIKQKLSEFVPDITTEKGRKEIASMARKVSTSKTVIVEVAKEITEEWVKLTKSVTTERIRAEKIFDELRDETRRPLTEWESIEKTRIANHEANVTAIDNASLLLDSNGILRTLLSLKASLDYLNSLTIDDTWEEYKMLCMQKCEQGKVVLESKIASIEKAEAEKKEALEKERIQKEKEIAENAIREANERAERMRLAEAQKVEAAKKEVEEKHQLEKAKAEKALRDEQDKIKKLEEDKLKAEERSKKAELEAVEKERQRVALEKAKELQEKEKREKDLAHRKKINNESLDALVLHTGIDKDIGTKILTAIITHNIPHVSISY